MQSLSISSKDINTHARTYKLRQRSVLRTTVILSSVRTLNVMSRVFYTLYLSWHHQVRTHYV